MNSGLGHGGHARNWGVATDPAALRERDHVCWAFDDRTVFVENAIGFLREGLWRGMRVAYVGALPLHELIEEVRPLGDVDALMFQHRLRVGSLLDSHPDGYVGDERRQLAATQENTRQAERDGFSGYRVASDATSMVRTAKQRDAFTRFEHLVDRMMASEPFSAMCGYDRGTVGAAAVEELACVHPLAVSESAFHLYAPARASLALAGEIDAASGNLFRWALTRLQPQAGRALELDISGLGFIDHRALITLEEDARRRGRVITLRGGRQIVSNLASILCLDHVRTEEAA